MDGTRVVNAAIAGVQMGKRPWPGAKSPSPRNPVGSESSDETWHPTQAPSRESALNRKVLKKVPCSAS